MIHVIVDDAHDHHDDPSISDAMSIFGPLHVPESGASAADPAIVAALAVSLKTCAASCALVRVRICSKARYGKLKKKSLKVPKHVREKVSLANRKACRATEHIILDAKAPKHTRSSIKGWLPRSVLQSCFAPRADSKRSSTRAAIRMRRHRGSILLPKMRSMCSPLARSVTAHADQTSSSTSYIQSLRNATSNIILRHQHDKIHGLPERPDESAVLELSLDETEIRLCEGIELKLEKRRRTRYMHNVASVQVTHGTLDYPGEEEIPVLFPARVLSEKTADAQLETILQCLNQCFGSLDHIIAKVWFLILVIVSDAATTNKKSFRRLGLCLGECALLHSLCAMHQVSMAVGSCTVPVRVIGPMFCGCNLIRRGHWQAHTVKVLESLIGDERYFKVDFLDEEEVADGKFLASLLDLLEWDDCMLPSGDLQRRSRAAQARRLARHKLARFLTSDVRKGTTMRHRCKFGCCTDLANSRDKLWDLLMEIFITELPPVPALNQWTKLTHL